MQERDHPFKTSAFFRGGGVKNLSNLPTDSSKKLPTVGVKNCENFADILNGWSRSAGMPEHARPRFGLDFKIHIRLP